MKRTTLIVALGALMLLLAYGATLEFHAAGLPDEFIYLAGANRLAGSGSLAACFYTTDAILGQGYPHRDDHIPGYVIALALAFKVFQGGYWTAVGLNVVAYLLGAWLAGSLARDLGGRAWWVAPTLFLVLPTTLAYVFWIMAELVLCALFLGCLAVAARFGGRTLGAAAAGALLGATFLVRESALFGLPAALALLPRRRSAASFLAAFMAFTALVYVPLSVGRAAGGANFWVPTSGKAFGYQVVQSAQQGRLVSAAHAFSDRVATNWAEVRSTRRTEQGYLLLFAFLPLWALATLRGRSPRERRYYLALSAGWVAMVAVLLGVYVVARWSGFRYLMILMPAFLPALVPPPDRRARWWAPSLAFAAGLALLVPTHRILDPFKATSQNALNELAYVRRYLPADLHPRTVVLYRRGYAFGIVDPPVDVIFTLPNSVEDLRRLERTVWFDYAVVSPTADLGDGVQEGRSYRLLNGDDPDPSVRIYARRRQP